MCGSLRRGVNFRFFLLSRLGLFGSGGSLALNRRSDVVF